MRRNLRIDILLMSLFLIFWGSVVSAQTGTLLGKPKVRPGGYDSNTQKIPCNGPNEAGQICFESPVTFASLDFPCDLYAGLVFGDLGTIYTSLSDNSMDYDYYEGDFYVQPHYSANINFGCLDAKDVYSMLHSEELKNLYCESDDIEYIGSISITIEIYCNTRNGMVPVDYCENYDLFNNLAYDYSFDTGTEVIYNDISGSSVDCSLGIRTGLDVCCIEEVDPALSDGNIIDVSYQESEIRIDGNQLNNTFYQVYNVNGILQSSGQLDNVNFSQHTISDLYLKNGIYILILKGEGLQTSHKFVSFR